MKSLILPVNGILEIGVVRAVYDVLGDIKSNFRLYTAKSLLTDENLDIINNNWTIGDNDDIFVNGKPDTYLNTNFEAIYDTGLTSTNLLNSIDYSLPIIYDKDINFKVLPIRVATTIRLTIDINSKSKEKIRTLINAFNLLMNNGKEGFNHKLTIKFPIDNSILLLANEIYKLKENVKPEYNNFTKYLETILTKDSELQFQDTVTENEIEQGLAQANLVITDIQDLITGRFKNNINDLTIEKGENEVYYKTTLEYEFNVSLILYTYLGYNIVVYNQPLPLEYQYSLDDNEPHEDYDRYFKNYVVKFSDKSVKSGDFPIVNNNSKYLHIPPFDKEELNNYVPYSKTLFSVLTVITPEDRKTLFNLKELLIFKLDDKVLEFLRKEKEYITKMYNSIFYLTLYQDNLELNSNSLEVDGDLNVIAKEDLDITKTYRVLLKIVYNANHLTNRAKESLFEHRELLERVVAFMHPVESNQVDYEELEFEELKNIFISYHKGKKRFNIVQATTAIGLLENL